jgi:hypothetical protein
MTFSIARIELRQILVHRTAGVFAATPVNCFRSGDTPRAIGIGLQMALRSMTIELRGGKSLQTKEVDLGLSCLSIQRHWHAGVWTGNRHRNDFCCLHADAPGAIAQRYRV